MTQPHPFTIARTVDAPVEKVWKAFSEPDALKAWWGPKGTVMEVAAMEFRPGGLCRYSLREEDGSVIRARFEYKEIVDGRKITFIAAFSDEKGALARAPFFDGKWPLLTLTTVTFEDRGGKTGITLRAVPVEATEEEHALFLETHDSMKQGYGGSFDQLVTYLATH